MMKAIFLSSDPLLFDPTSEVVGRMQEYSNLFDEVHIIVVSKRKRDQSNISIGENIFLYSVFGYLKIIIFLKAFKIAKQIKNRANAWIILSQDPFELGFLGLLLSKSKKDMLIIQIHTDILNPYFINESFKNRFRVIFAKYTIQRAKRIQVVSRRIEQSLVKKWRVNKDKIIVLPIFVDAEIIKRQLIQIDLHKRFPNFRNIILMASRLSKEKNINLAIDMMHSVVQKNKNILLVIVGDGPEKDRLQKKVRGLNLLDNIVFYPWTNDLVSFYKTSDIFLITSNYEGYGRTIIEAIAAGTPVISTDVGCANEIIVQADAGYVFPVQNINALVRIIEECINIRTKEFFQLGVKNAQKQFFKKEVYLRQLKTLFE